MLKPLPVPQLRSLRAHPFVWLIAVLSLIPLLAITAWGLSAVDDWFVPASVGELSASPWRIISPTFVHYTLLHAFTNIYLWWYFGAKLEERSRIELVLLFVLAAVVGNSAQWFWSGPNFGGLSGVVYALLSYCWCITYFYKTPILQLDKGLSIILLIFLPIAATGLLGQFANAAHGAGLCCGLLMAAGKYALTFYQPRT